jgi:VanZ family protein
MKTLVIWLAVVTIISVVPLERDTLSFQHADKMLHFILYAITSLLFYTYLKESKAILYRKNAVLFSVLYASAFGLIMEFAQRYTSTREFSIIDAAFNILGAIVGVLYIKYIQSGSNRRINNGG